MARRDRSSRTPSTARPSFPIWVAACFFVSGAAGLIYEVAWSKQLGYLLGNSLHAVATVTAAFLGGLALGAHALGPTLAERSRPIRSYALLELGVAVLGLISMPVLRGLDPLVGVLYRTLGGESAAFAVARAALALIVLAPPAVLMGATLPLMVAHVDRDRVGSGLARLYGINTLGAVAGTIAAGFALLPLVGLTVATWIAAALNVAAGAVAWLAARGAGKDAAIDRPSAMTDGVPRVPRAGELSGRSYTTFALLFLASGFAALSFQMVWVRLFTLIFGSSVHSFAAVLSVYLLGLALGGLACGRALRRPSLAGFAWLELALALTAALQLLGFSRLPQWMYDLTVRAGGSWGALVLGECALLAMFLLPSCMLLGASFPIATRLLQKGDAAGRATGIAYAVNTAGTIAGSWFTGFVAIPHWGVQPAQVVTLLLSAAIGLACLALAAKRRETSSNALAGAAGLLVAVCVAVVAAPRWQPALMSKGLYRPIQAEKIAASAVNAPDPRAAVAWAARSEHVLYYAEGINGSVMVGSDDEGRERWLRVGGKVDAGTGRDMETQVVLGLIPAACADSGARALVVGLGSGVTLSAALAAGAGLTEVVELEPRVVEASRFFHPKGQHPLDDPRVRLIVGDARTHLAHGGGRYGLIVSEPSNPWIAGVNSLFTVDFYQRVRARLEPRGVFCQWIQLYELSPQTLASMVASFQAVFPAGDVYLASRNSDMLLVAAPPDARIALERLWTPEVRRVLRRGRIESPEALAGFHAGPLASLSGLAANAPLNRDDLPIVEYRAPRDLVTVGRAKDLAHPLATGVVSFHERYPDGPLYSAWTREGWLTARVRMLLERDDTDHAAATARVAREMGLTELASRLDGEIEGAERRLMALGEAERARALLAGGRDAEGVELLRRAAELDPSNRRIRLWIADRRRLAGDLEGAESDLALGRAGGDAEIQADAALIHGMLEIDRSRPLVAAARFHEAQRWRPERPDGYLFEAAARAAGGDSSGARQVIERGLQQLPGDGDLSSLLSTIDGIP